MCAWTESVAQSVVWAGAGGAVEHPDCLVVETVFELADFGPETLQSLS